MHKIIIMLLFMMQTLMIATASQAGEEQVPKVKSWSTQELHTTLAAMPDGDISKGRKIHQSMMCASCHGKQGVSPSRNYTTLAGQRSEYTYKMLIDYKQQRRNEGDPRAQIMIKIAQLLNSQDMADLADYYASLPSTTVGITDDIPADIEKLVRKGDPQRLLTPCASCHGVKGQGGINESPAIAGQVKDYLVRTMQAFKKGNRTNDVHQGMSQFAISLTDAEIELLAEYYSSLQP
jgi:cytochrome c553